MELRTPDAVAASELKDMRSQLSRKHEAQQALNLEVKDLRTKLKQKADMLETQQAKNQQLQVGARMNFLFFAFCFIGFYW